MRPAVLAEFTRVGAAAGALPGFVSTRHFQDGMIGSLRAAVNAACLVSRDRRDFVHAVNARPEWYGDEASGQRLVRLGLELNKRLREVADVLDMLPHERDADAIEILGWLVKP